MRLAVWLAVGFAVSCRPSSDAPDAGQAPIQGIAAKVDAMAPPTVENVARVTGLTLAAGPTPGNPRYQSHVGTDPRARPFTRAELRVGPGGNLLVLDVAPGATTAAEARRVYGAERSLSYPTPHEPADAPAYLVYERPWGALRLGFDKRGEGSLITVVLDATRP